MIQPDPPMMTNIDKNNLRNNIGYLSTDAKKKIVPIVQKCL